MSSIERQIRGLQRIGKNLTGYCVVRIYDTVGKSREFLVSNVDYARSRVKHYQENWKFFQTATISIHDGVCWLEI